MIQRNQRGGFTLIELLVVIAIIAILSVVLILTLNPAELLRQARDSNRVSDLATLKSAISLYLSDVASPSIITASTDCFMSAATTTATATNCGNSFVGRTTMATSSATAGGLAVTGVGWIPVNFGSISSGAPLGNLPMDPTNSGVNAYRYTASSTGLTFELNADLESSKYTNVSTGLENTDGGNSSTVYEVGTTPGYF